MNFKVGDKVIIVDFRDKSRYFIKCYKNKVLVINEIKVATQILACFYNENIEVFTWRLKKAHKYIRRNTNVKL